MPVLKKVPPPYMVLDENLKAIPGLQSWRGPGDIPSTNNETAWKQSRVRYQNGVREGKQIQANMRTGEVYGESDTQLGLDKAGFHSLIPGASPVVVELLTHDGPDRMVRVHWPFLFIDRSGRWWKIPKGFVSDGASIPRIFWSPLLIGHPLMGDYRRAAIVHDFACAALTGAFHLSARLNNEPPPPDYFLDPRIVHRTLYDACVVDGLTRWKRWAMWRAVDRFGPQGRQQE